MENLEYIKKLFPSKKILLTGASGFKGSWLIAILEHTQCEIVCLDIKPQNKNLYKPGSRVKFINQDIKDFENLDKIIQREAPDIIFHLAAQSLVSRSYKNVGETFRTNLFGTLNLFESAKKLEKKVTILNVTTDKVYKNLEWNFSYRELDPLGGNDPYSASKACVEILSQCYSRSIFDENVLLINVRSGNVIGGGDWNEDRIVPDLFRSIKAGKALNVRNINSIRPWQHVLDPLLAYIKLAEKVNHSGSTNFFEYNVGPGLAGEVSVLVLLEEFKKHLEFDYKINEDKTVGYESVKLALETSKIKLEHNWTPLISLELAVKLTTEWYSCVLKGSESSSIVKHQIENVIEGKA